jgi:hypothetical protein
MPNRATTARVSASCLTSVRCTMPILMPLLSAAVDRTRTNFLHVRPQILLNRIGVVAGPGPIVRKRQRDGSDFQAALANRSGW